MVHVEDDVRCAIAMAGVDHSRVRVRVAGGNSSGCSKPELGRRSTGRSGHDLEKLDGHVSDD
eukprot:10002868-Alexandrium_andersonii.AAC.1